MVLSELTNKELKGILRENDVRNYSKLNKKNLVKKVNQLIKAQNGGKSKKKYRLRGGSPLKNGNQGDTAPATATAANGPAPAPDAVANGALVSANGATPGDPVSATPANTPGAPAAPAAQGATAPPLENNQTQTNTNKDHLMMVYSANPKNKNSIGKAEGLTPTQKYGNIKPTNSSTNNSANNKDACGACSIL